MYTPYCRQVPENVRVTKTTVETLGYNTLEKYGVTDWKITWGNQKKTVGEAQFRTKTVELSEFLFDRLKDKRDMLDVVLHEIAHVLAGYAAAHNNVWKTWCVRIGARPVRCYRFAQFDIKPSDYKYNFVCKVHGYQAGASRLPKRKASCPKCCRRYNENYLLKVVQNW